MPAKINQTLTPLELEIMQVIWDVGPCTVAEVQPKLKADLAYTTVQTMLNVLLRKNKVKRVQEGRAYRYRPAVSRERASGSALSDLVKRMLAVPARHCSWRWWIPGRSARRSWRGWRRSWPQPKLRPQRRSHDGASAHRVRDQRPVASSAACGKRMVAVANGQAGASDPASRVASRS